MILKNTKNIPISNIDTMKEYPRELFNDESMKLLFTSIKERGVLVPVVVRKKEDGRYEMINGHRRMHVCKELGFETIRCEVTELTRNKAIKKELEKDFYCR